MKDKSIISIVLSLQLVCLLSVAAFADGDSGTSTAKITFEEGDFESADKADLDDDTQNMGIDFEERDIPVVDTTFVAEDGERTLRVMDSRENAGDWHVSGSVGKYYEDGGGQHRQSQRQRRDRVRPQRGARKPDDGLQHQRALPAPFRQRPVEA